MTSSHLSSNPFSMKVFFLFVLRIRVRQRKRLAVDISATCTMLMDIDTFIPFLCSHSISIVQSFIAVEMFLLCVIISGTGKKKEQKEGTRFLCVKPTRGFCSIPAIKRSFLMINDNERKSFAFHNSPT